MSQQMQYQYGSNQRLFNQQRRMNGWGTTGSQQLQNQISPQSAHHKQWVSSDDVDQMVQITESNIDHIGFVPPAPQSKAEMEKLAQWQAQRKGIKVAQQIVVPFDGQRSEMKA